MWLVSFAAPAESAADWMYESAEDSKPYERPAGTG